MKNLKVHFSSIILFLIIYTSGGVKILPHFVTNTLCFVLLSLALILNKDDLYKIYKVSKSKTFIFFGILLIIFAFNILLNIKYADLVSYAFLLYYFVIAFFAFVYFSSISFIETLYRILKVILFLALFSIIIQLLFSLFFLYIKVDSMRYHYFPPIFLYSFLPFSFLGFNFYRICLFFWEPGVLQIYLNLLLFFALFVFKQRRIQLLTTIAIIFTFSSAGYLILLVQLVIYFKKEIFRSLKFTFLGLLFFAILIPVIKSNIEDKFTGKSRMSFIVRYYDTEMAINNILNNPIKGIGMQNADTYSNYRSSNRFLNLLDLEVSPQVRDEILDREGGGSTNSLLKVAEYFGLIVFFIFLYFLYKTPIIIVKKRLFFFILLIAMSTEPLLFTPFFIYLFVSGIFYNKKTKLNEQ